MLDTLVYEAKKVYGEPEYKYYKKQVSWFKERRKRGRHVRPLNDGTEVTEKEYLENIAESDRCETKAFMGDLPRSYDLYRKKLVVGGWKERLLELIESS